MKKLFSPLLILGILSTFLCSCGTGAYDWVVEINGTKVRPEQYIMAEMQAYIEAQMQADTSGEYATVDGVEVGQWVGEKTVNNLKTAYFISQEFDMRGLVIDEFRREYITALRDNAWENVSDFYMDNGVTADYYEAYLEYLYKKQLVFEDIYLSDEKQNEIQKLVDNYLNENLSLISIFAIPTVNDDGTSIDDEQAALIEKLSETAVKELNRGENIGDVAGNILSQTAEILGAVEDYSDGAQFVETGYLSAVSPNVSSEIKELIKQLKTCTAMLYPDENCIFVVYKNELYTTDEEYNSLKLQVVTMLKDAEYNELINEHCQTYDVVYNDAAVKFYSPSKIVARLGD